MNSLEALEELKDKAQLLALFMGKDASDHLVNVDSLYNTIKQDLERLETLEKENQEWKEENEYLKSEGFPCEYKVLKDNYKFLKEDFDDLKKENLEEINLRIRTQMQCSKLEKEKHSLENEIEILKCRIDQLSYRNVSQENEKLKKVIEIYTKISTIDKESTTSYLVRNGMITQQEYELLKEVLGE